MMRKHFVNNLLVLLLLGASALSAHARDGERHDRGDGSYGGGDRGAMREQRQMAREERQRDVRAVQQMQPPVNQPRSEPQQDRRGSRMSPEDRRALRRQIDQASHDIYAPNR